MQVETKSTRPPLPQPAGCHVVWYSGLVGVVAVSLKASDSACSRPRSVYTSQLAAAPRSKLSLDKPRPLNAVWPIDVTLPHMRKFIRLFGTDINYRVTRVGIPYRSLPMRQMINATEYSNM
jgi:hypothetical protein